MQHDSRVVEVKLRRLQIAALVHVLTSSRFLFLRVRVRDFGVLDHREDLYDHTILGEQRHGGGSEALHGRVGAHDELDDMRRC